MEKEQYQIIAEKVRADIQAGFNSNPSAYFLIKDPTTLKGGCQYTAKMVRNALRSEGEEARLFKLHYKRGNSLWEQGKHIVAIVDGLIIDPSITQYFPEMTQFVFDETSYPLPIASREDVSHSTMLK